MEPHRTPRQITLIGHPFSQIGNGRSMRVAFAACRSVGIDVAVRDVWNLDEPNAAQAASIVPKMTTSYGAVNVFHLNGDEVGPAFERIGPPPAGYKIIVPFWELSRYPTEWARQLERFDEVWAASEYIQKTIADAVARPVIRMPLGIEVSFEEFRSRRYFGIREDSYVFLFFFDCRSYITRKNPQAVVECFRRLVAMRPWSHVCLVMKIHGIEQAPLPVQDFLDSLSDLHERVVLLTGTMSENDVHNLVRCSDAFVSLHRSEGYGHGMAEAMYLGLPVIATGYSGNLEFMTSEVANLVGYSLIPVPAGAYPHAEGQRWAEPDLDQAVSYMAALVDNPSAGRAIGAKASRHIRTNFSYRASGLRYIRRLDEIMSLA
jgi:glycosyltransferase involved in cell wall biosynthesis